MSPALSHNTPATGQRSPNTTSRSSLVLHPYLLAVFPVVTIWAGNIREVTFFEGTTTCIMMLTTTAVAMKMARWYFPTRQRAGLAVAIVIILMVSFGIVDKLNSLLTQWNSPLLLRDKIALPIWAIFLILALWWINHEKGDDRRLTRLANVFTGSLTAMCCGLMVTAISISPWIWQRPSRGKLVPAESIVLNATDNPPDVYLLMFDRYAGADTLKNDFGYDNSGFLNGLRQRGLHVWDTSFANYPKTELEMSAILNMCYHGETVWPKCRYREMLKDHVVGRLFKKQGYRYYHLGNLHNGIRSNPNAHYSYRFSKMPTELTENLFKMTPFYRFFPTTDEATQTLRKFELVADIASHDKPKFVYAHFLVPHVPWKFNRNGSSVTAQERTSRSEVQHYVNQLIFTNRRITELVDVILAVSDRPPIIILQADEGPELRYANDDQKTVTERIHKRSGILSAIHFPERDPIDVITQGFSPVNTFRLIFREYFGAEIELLEDRYFYWEPENCHGKPDLTKPCRFVEVTDRLTSGG